MSLSYSEGAKKEAKVHKVICVVVLYLVCGVGFAASTTQEVLKLAESSMKATTDSVKKGIDEALMLIREITGENASAHSNEVLESIQKIENNALNAVDELALNGPFMNALNDARVEIRQTLKTVEKMEQSPNRDRNHATLKNQSERFDDLQESISKKEGEITLLLGKFSGLKRDIEISIRIGKIDQLISSLEGVQENLEEMSSTLGEVLKYEVGEVQDVVVTN